MSRRSMLSQGQNMVYMVDNVICAWCGKHLSGPVGSVEISHGICEPCETKFNEQLEEFKAVE